MSNPNEMLDVAWLLICAALVMLMQAGFTCLESGSVRSKNSINVAAKNFADFCVSSAVFWLFGFALMFGISRAGLFGTSGFFFSETSSPWLMAFFIFQMGFCGTAATIISGAVAERMRFIGYLVVTFILSSFIYPVVGHWVWGSAAGVEPGGWLERKGFIDFAGCTVVHSVGGWMSLAAVIIVGPRIGRFGDNSIPIHGHALPIVTLGVFLLWFGWFGFNGGSTFGVTPEVPSIIVNTAISGVFGGLTALFLSRWLSGRADVMMIMNGSLAGLVGITASAHLMTPISAVGIGCIASVVMYSITVLLEKLQIDDVVGAVPVHLGAGVWGTLAVAIFASPEVWGTGLTRWEQLSVQAVGVGVTFVWAFGVGFSLLWLFNRLYPLRIDSEGERIGLNVAEHDATTEILDLLNSMETHRQTHDYSKHVPVEPHTEIGQIAQQYNRVLDEINTERERLIETTESLKKKTSLLLLLQKAAAASNEAKTIEYAVKACLDDICAFTGWPVGHCFQVDDVTGEMVSSKIWHLDDPEKFQTFRKVTEGIRLSKESGLVGRVLATGKPIWIPDVTRDLQFRRAKNAKDIEVQGGFALPVVVGRNVVAILEFFSTKNVELDDTVLEVMTSVGTQLGRVIERARSEAARFKTVLDNMPAVVFLKNLEGQFQLVNQTYKDMYGIGDDEIRGKTLYDIYPKDKADEFTAVDQLTVDQKKMFERENTIEVANETRYLRSITFPVFDLDGHLNAFGGIEIDVTERKRAEEKLEEAYEVIREQKERMEEELDIGRKIQLSMVPQAFPAFPDRSEFDIHAILKPARQVGGDFYDFYFIDENRLCFCIGDVAGKGVPAALFMAMTKTLIKSRSVDDYSTASIVTHVNNALKRDNKVAMFVTLVLGILHVRTGELLYTNAGHNYPYIRRSDSSVEALMQTHGPIVGAVHGLTYTEEKIALKAGDIIFLYTDGITEAMNREGKIYSDLRLLSLLEMGSNGSLDHQINYIVSDVEKFELGVEQTDDVTMLALGFNGIPEVEKDTR